MVRAAIVIGVKKTGNLPTLQAVDRCVDLVSKWGEAQRGMGGRVTVISDAGGAAVIADAVRSVIKSVVDLGTVEQLLVYFAGHGVNVRHNEYWLLTNAPEDPNAAVNVRASIDLARDCGIPHVVFISDACRTAADSIQAQDVQGSIIFPNVSSGTEPGNVDVFYASRLGLPALEVRDVKAASDGFEAAFTTVLVAGLSGARSELVQSEGSDNSIGRVHPWPLKRYLQAEVPRFLLQHHVALNISQTPDAIITSAPEAWLAEVSVSTGQGVRGITLRDALQAPPPETVPSVVQSLVSGIIRSGSGSNQIQTLRRTPEGEPVVVVGDVLYGLTLGGSRSNNEMETLTQMPGGEHFMEVLDKVTPVGGAPFPDCQCGFRIKGTKVLQALSPSGRIAIAADGSLVQMWDVPAPASNTLLIFENGTGALLHCLAG